MRRVKRYYHELGTTHIEMVDPASTEEEAIWETLCPARTAMFLRGLTRLRPMF